MARYKIEREYLFSNKSYNEICDFLKNSDAIDLSKVRDNNGNTGLHQAAYSVDGIKLLKKYLQYMEKYCSKMIPQKNNNKDPQQYFNEFVNSQNKDGYTPLHFAAYKGNYKALDQLCKSGADYTCTTGAGQNVLHLAAQGDMVQTFIYFEALVDINCRDSKNSTPLHWASYMNSESIITYLLSNKNIDINARDQNKQTALHLATTYGHTKIVKMLLRAGADRYIQNMRGQNALKIAEDNEFRNIEKILNQNYGCLDYFKLYLNIKTVYKRQERSIKKPIFFMFCFLLVALIRHLLFQIENGYNFLRWIDIGFDSILIFLYVALIIGNKKPKPQKFINFLNGNINMKKVCLSCAALKPPRSLHCEICKMCIQRYDHHCFWINNCVGKRNLKKFIFFIILFLLFLFQMLTFSIAVLINIFQDQKGLIYPRQDQHYDKLQKIAAIIYLAIIGIFSLCFIFPMISLIYVQLKNVLLNKTTYERYTKQNISTFTESSSHLLTSQIKSNKDKKYSISNALTMCRDDGSHDSQNINTSLSESQT